MTKSFSENHVSLAWSMFVALILLASWELAARGSENILFLFSKPSQILSALLAMAISGTLVVDMAVTTAEVLLGTAAGTVLGSALGLALWLSTRTARIAAPFVVMAANFPIFALAPAAIVWLGIGLGMKVFLAAFATFFVSLQLAHRGAGEAVKQFTGGFDGFRAKRQDIYLKVIVPGAMESVFSAMRVNVGLGVLGAFIGEFIAADRGLGRAIVRASGLYQIDRVFAASLCIIVLASLLDRLAYGIQKEKLLLARAFGLPRVLRVHSKMLKCEQKKELAG